MLKEFNCFREGSKLKLLDVGALGDNFRKESSLIDATAIDLNSCHPAVKQVTGSLHFRFS